MQKNTRSVLLILANSVLLMVLCFAQTKQATAQSVQQPEADAETDSIEPQFMTGVRQITFEGKRAGEGYFSTDASLMVFQSERRADNPFYQMYLLDFHNRRH